MKHSIRMAWRAETAGKKRLPRASVLNVSFCLMSLLGLQILLQTQNRVQSSDYLDPRARHVSFQILRDNAGDIKNQGLDLLGFILQVGA